MSSTRRHRWGVILAGGNGERLRPLTRFISGDDRPKQFCPLLEGGQTLLAMSRARIAKTVSPARTLFVVTSKHEPFYSIELADVPPARVIAQPSNRGTLAAVVSSLARIAQFDPGATVAFFPSDHYYSRERTFRRGMLAAFAAAKAAPNSVILLGTKALSPEPSYGYIEPGDELPGPCGRLKRVGKFWEKPSTDFARELLDRGCLWNTFVTVGRVGAFVDLIEAATPGFCQAFEPIFCGSPEASPDWEAVYNQIPAADFSKLVLSAGAERTAVLDLGDIGWSDLGDPHRLIATLSQHGIRSPWRQLWLREMGIARVAGA